MARKRTRDASTIVLFAALAAYALLTGVWWYALPCAWFIGATALTFDKPHAKFDPSKSRIQQWNERRRS